MDSVWLALAGVVLGCFAVAAMAWFLGRAEDRRLIAKERNAERAADPTVHAAR